MPIVPFLIIVIAIISMVSRANKQKGASNGSPQDVRTADQRAAQSTAKRLEELRKLGEQAASAMRETEEQRRARQEELKRRLQENARRRAAEQASAPKPTQERRPLEKRTMQSTLQKERPVAAHSDDDCGGGSIHDGYHEGVTQFENRPGVSVAGNLGHRLADEDDRAVREAIAAENAKRAMARIAKLPPLAQGMVYSEILGKPKSEIA